MKPNKLPVTFLRVLLLVAVYLFPAAGIPSLHAAPQSAKSDAEPGFVLAHREQFFIAHPYPPYPYAARKADMVGKGIFQLNFDAAGKVSDIVLLRSTGHDLLDRVCLQTFVRWQLRHPGEVKKIRIPINFTIETR